MPATLGVTRLVDGADVGVFEQRQGVGFALEHSDLVVVDELTTPNHLERHPSLRILLLGFEHHPHPTFTQLAQDLVLADGRRKTGGKASRCRVLRCRHRGVLVEGKRRVGIVRQRLVGPQGQIPKGLLALHLGPIRIFLGHGRTVLLVTQSCLPREISESLPRPALRTTLSNRQ